MQENKKGKKHCKADFAPSQVFRVSSVERLLP
jgi:hypothetical protein